MSEDFIARLKAYEAGRGGAHSAGTLMEHPLRTIEYYLSKYFTDGRSLKTVETGCGASTILFSHYSGSHRAYCLDDRSQDNSSVAFAENFPGFRTDNVEFVFGPTQQTIFETPLSEHVDVVLIDGPHGYPFPELEYFAFCRWLKPGGILIVDDVHIPTINNFYRFLCEDDMFFLHSVVNATAFFVRSDAPLFDQRGDGWWQQRYNMQRFPAYAWDKYSVGIALPINLSFTGRLASLEPYFTRGFILVDGDPVTEGSLSIIRLPLDAPVSGRIRVDLVAEIICAGQRPEASLSVYINDQPGQLLDGARIEASASNGGRNRLHSYVVDLADTRQIEIKLGNSGLKTGDQLEGWMRTYYDKRQPGIRVVSIAIMAQKRSELEAQKPPAPVVRRDGAIVSFSFRGFPMKFFVDRPDDSIQGHHYSGQLYESDELDLLASLIRRGARILDIGANIGNHTVFFEKALGASRIVPIECQRRAIDLYKTNVILNELRRVDLSYLGVAFDEEEGWGRINISQDFNMAGGSVEADSKGEFRRVIGDTVLKGQTFDFIKCDVEGSELKVLRGLTELIKSCSPELFVEVWEENAAEFKDWATSLGYSVVNEIRRYDIATNLYLKRSALRPVATLRSRFRKRAAEQVRRLSNFGQ